METGLTDRNDTPIFVSDTVIAPSGQEFRVTFDEVLGFCIIDTRESLELLYYDNAKDLIVKLEKGAYEPYYYN